MYAYRNLFSVDIWAVGCILAELFGRKPLFPGKSHWEQLGKIVSVIGTPAQSETGHIVDARAQAYLAGLPFSPKAKYKEMFPHANMQGKNVITHHF